VLRLGAQVEALAPERLRRMVENKMWRLLGKYQKVKMDGKTKKQSKYVHAGGEIQVTTKI